MTLEDYRRRQAQTKKRAILDAARASFVADGFDRTSVEALAGAAGVSTATVYSHFGSKTALFAAVIEDAVSSLSLEPASDLRTVARSYARLLSRPDVRGLLRLVASESPRFPELGEALFEHGKSQINGVFSRALEAEARRGRLAPRDDWTRLTGQISGMIMQSTFLPWLFWPGASLADPVEIADAAVDLVLRG